MAVEPPPGGRNQMDRGGVRDPENGPMRGTAPEAPGATEPDCVFCQRVDEVERFRDLVVFEDGAFLVSHQIGEDGTKALGILHVQTKRHVPSLGQMNRGEAATLGPLLGRLSRALEARTRAPWTYCFGFNEGARHVHLVLGCRYAGLPEPYLRLRFAEWPGSPRGDRPEIARLCAALREDLSGAPTLPPDHEAGAAARSDDL